MSIDAYSGVIVGLESFYHLSSMLRVMGLGLVGEGYGVWTGLADGKHENIGHVGWR